MFAGYGGAEFALKKARIDHECVGYSEIDRYAIECFEQNHKGHNYGDCTKIDPYKLPDFDLLTGGFPCQSFSVAGKGKGELDTRGTLFNEIIRIANIKQPRYMLLENVKGLTFKPHKKTFEKILSELGRIGYYVHWKVLNSKEHGICQNRERIFFVCFRNKEDYGNFNFPEKEELKIFLKDILEEEVDEKYCLNDAQIEKLLSRTRSFNERMCKKDVAGTLLARDYKDPRVVKIYEVNGGEDSDKTRPRYVQIDKGHHSQQDRYYLTENRSPTTVQNVPKIFDVYNNKIKEDIVPTLSDPCHNNLRVVEPFILKNHSIMVGNLSRYTMKYPRNPYNKDERVSWCVDTKNNNGISQDDFRIRKLTPKEYFRLMGFLNDEINLEGLSNTQKYKLAGNGWDINLVSKIFKEMFR